MSQELRNAVAIIGLGGRFPDASDLRQFWENIRDGRESIVDFTDQEILACGVPPELIADPNYVKRGTVLDGVDLFDAGFFGFNRREAELIDPQHRIFLECAWEALEDAGYAGDLRPESVGVFAGCSLNSYLVQNLLANPAAVASAGGYQVMLASDKDFLATRVSYKLNLRGPSLTVQSACSTSLVAVNLACQQLLSGQCDMALAGGASIGFPQKAGYLYTEGMILSPDGHCRPFDARGRGIRAGSGAGIVVLKRLSDAIRDRDNIRAVIRGVGVNNDGGGKMGYTAPSVEGEAGAITAAFKMAGVDPATVAYVEAHGTATQVGDPIEVTALSSVFRKSTDRRQFVALGSVKSNLGHLDAAAGVAGLVKTVLALENATIPPTVHFTEPNPQLQLEESPFYVTTEPRPWTVDDGRPRRAGVSSFGIGGTNAHTVLEEAPEAAPVVRRWPSQLITLSARSAAALDKAALNLGRRLAEARPDDDLASICFTLHTGRKEFPYRRSVVASTGEQAARILLDPQRASANIREASGRNVVFLFSGQGSQYPAMAVRLRDTDPAFRRVFDECCDALTPHLRLDLRDVLYGDQQDGGKLSETWLAQPALFAIEYALAQMWINWGIRPKAMLGHSIGEYTAACISGVLPLDGALRLVAMRGRLMQQMPSGAMLAVPLSAERLRPMLPASVDIAAMNTPGLCTVSGPHADIDAFERQLEDQGVNCRRLHTSHAFHSSMMEPVLKPFEDEVRNISLNAPTIPFVSNVTGRWITEAEATDPAYWARHLRGSVRFADGLRECATLSPVLLEVGPGEVLSTFARQCGSAPADVCSSLPHPQSPTPDTEHVLTTLGRLWTAGVPVDWQRFHEGEQLRRVSLPTYPFERQRYFIEPAANNASAAPAPTARKTDVNDWFYVPSWKRAPSPDALVRQLTAPNKTWLVFANASDLCSSVLRAVSALKTDKAAIVTAGTEYHRAAAGSYTIRAGVRDDYSRLLGDLQADGFDPDSILHLWSVTDPGQSDSIEDLGYFSLMFLAQSLSEFATPRTRDILAISNGTHSVLGTETITPEKSLALSPVKVLPAESRAFNTRAVDVESCDPMWAASNLLLEHAVERQGRILAYRCNQVWQQDYEPVRLNSGHSSVSLRERGVYLITGGLGGIGLVLARHLAKTVHARLVLTARSPLPPRSEWETYLSSAATGDATARKIQQLLEIESLGGEVLVGAADVTDEQAMMRVLTEARNRFGAIHGAVHAAGLAGGGVLELRTRENVTPVLAPKVTGTRILARLIEEDHPDFLLLCSSIDSIVGRAAALDYCAANLFLNSFAAAQHGLQGTHVVSANWDTWQETGMAVNATIPAHLESARKDFLQHAIRNDEGCRAFDAVLGTSLNEVAVLTRDLSWIQRTAEQQEPAQQPAAGATAAATAGAGGTITSSQAGTPTAEAIGAIWREALGVERVAPTDNFFDLGGHSLLGTRVLARIRLHFGVTLPLRTIFEAPTAGELADRIDALLWAASSSAIPDEDASEREEIEL